MKKILFLLLILSLSCSSKKERIENKLMECINDIEDENGIKLKKYIVDFENLLIKKKKLKNKSDKSYKNLLVRFAQKDSIKIEIDEDDSLYVKIYTNTFDDSIFQKILACYPVLNKDSLKYDYQKFNLLKKASKQLTEETSQIDNSTIAKAFSSILTEEDFKLDFYKAMLLNAIIEYNRPSHSVF